MEFKNYRDLKKLGDKVIEVDVKTEKFDFDKYDYYIIEPVKKKGIDTEELKNVEVTKKAINASKEIIKDVKKDIKRIEINTNYPEEHKEDISFEVTDISNKISILKEELSKIDGVDIIIGNVGKSKIVDYIEEYKSMNNEIIDIVFFYILV